MAAMANHLDWVPAQFASSDEYIVELGEQGAAEVLEAVKRFNGLGEDGDSVDASNFVLPSVAPALERASSDVHVGKGFVIIRGLKPNDLSVEDNMVAFLGIASYVGGDKRGVQDRKGNVLTHVTDSKAWTVAPERRHVIHTKGELPFHNDMGASILALHIRQSANAGGDTYIAPAATIFNQLKEKHPNVARTLSEATWPIQVSGSPPRHILMPLVQEHEGKIMMSLDPGRLSLPGGFNTSTDGSVPALSEAQQHAYQVLAEHAQSYCLRLDIQPGDMLFLNNWAVLHARDAYVDNEQSAGRHLVRLWLHDSKKGWNVPSALSPPWEAAFGIGGDCKTSWSKGHYQYAVVPPSSYKPPRYVTSSAAFLAVDEEDAEDVDSA